MKNKLLAFCLLFSLSTTAQTILTVRQGFDDGTTTFSSIQAAVDAANASSIIYVYPGVYDEDVLIDKGLRMVGPGYRLNDNFPGESWTNLDADLTGNITITGAEAVLVEGMKLRSVYATSAASATFQQCWIFRAIFSNATVQLKRIFFSGGSWGNNGNEATEHQLRILGQSYITLTNSMFVDSYSGNGRLALIYAGGATNGALGTLVIDRCFINNRLFCGRLAVVIKNSFGYVYGSQLEYGLSYNRYNNFVSGNWGGNNTTLSNASAWEGLLVGFPDNFDGLSFDARYQLTENSPARNAADDGGDCGPFGGVTPYIPSGVPALPFVYEFVVPEEGTTGEGINVNVKVRTQN